MHALPPPLARAFQVVTGRYADNANRQGQAAGCTSAIQDMRTGSKGHSSSLPQGQARSLCWLRGRLLSCHSCCCCCCCLVRLADGSRAAAALRCCSWIAVLLGAFVLRLLHLLRLLCLLLLLLLLAARTRLRQGQPTRCKAHPAVSSCSGVQGVQRHSTEANEQSPTGHEWQQPPSAPPPTSAESSQPPAAAASHPAAAASTPPLLGIAWRCVHCRAFESNTWRWCLNSAVCSRVAAGRAAERSGCDGSWTINHELHTVGDKLGLLGD